jgi:hypothetical protein
MVGRVIVDNCVSPTSKEKIIRELQYRRIVGSNIMIKIRFIFLI